MNAVNVDNNKSPHQIGDDICIFSWQGEHFQDEIEMVIRINQLAKNYNL